MLRRVLSISTFVVVLWIAGALTSAPAQADRGPVATAAGDAPAPPLPSLVQTPLSPVDRAPQRLTDAVNDADSVRAAKGSKVVRRQLAAAWRGARYYVLHAPTAP